MATVNVGALEKSATILVLLMAIIQLAYAVYGFADPVGFSALRGTALSEPGGSEWVRIYASRTLFIALIVGVLLYVRNYKVLVWAAIMGTVMPLTDAVLAYQDQAANNVILKHVATCAYLTITAIVLKLLVKAKAHK